MKQTKLLFVSVALLLSACMPIQPGATPPATMSTPTKTPVSAENSLVNTQWQLVSFGAPGAEAPGVGDKPITLEFRPGGQVVGSGGCNSFGAKYQVQGATLSITQVISTKMACVAQGVTEQESRYFQALAAAGSFTLADHHLTIQYDNGQRVLNFTPASAVATPPANETPTITATTALTTTPPPTAEVSLTGTAWALSAWGAPSAETPVTTPTITLKLTADGRASGSSGCNSYSGTYVVQNSTVAFSELVSTLKACTDEQVMQAEQEYLAALKTANEFTVTGHQLTIQYDAGSKVLTFISAMTTTVAPTTTLATTQPGPALDDRTDPTVLLASYIDAINRKEYPRAYSYWETPPNNQSLDQFTQGFTDTASVDLLINPPVHQEGAAGSVYASVPTVLIATHTDHIPYIFSGCYVARRSNQGNGNAPEANPWRLYRGDLVAAPADANLITLLQHACPDAPPLQGAYNNLSTPVDLLASFVDALNRKEYRRAYDYWETPPNQQTFDQFAKGYVDTKGVFLVVHLPTQNDVGAGQQYAGISTWLVATHTDGTKPNFVGCYVAHRPNPNITGAPKSGAWHLNRATVRTAPNGADPVELLTQACAPQ